MTIAKELTILGLIYGIVLFLYFIGFNPMYPSQEITGFSLIIIISISLILLILIVLNNRRK